MDINFDSKTAAVFKEISYQTKFAQEICEAVVPDTDEDIGSLATVQSTVLLKSKDNTSRGVLVTGEACASVMYINETQDKVSCIKLKRAFTMEFDLAEPGADVVSQVKLRVASTEVRLINPRKISLCFEIAGELSCFAPQEMALEYGIPKEHSAEIHAKYENIELNTVSSVREKTFALAEQFSFPAGKPKPSKLVSADTDFVMTDTQIVGTKVIAKGSAVIAVSYLSEEVNYPLKTEFTASFSQIVDIGENKTDSCSIIPELTGIYYNIADSISGEKILDIELHALLQLTCRSACDFVYISDAYSNLKPAVCCKEKSAISYVLDERKLKLSADDRINISESCLDVLSVFLLLSNIEQNQEKIIANINLDVVYKKADGGMGFCRRCIKIENECPAQAYRINSARLTDVFVRPDGQWVECHVGVEFGCLTFANAEIEKVCSVNVDENAMVDFSQFPSITLVRNSGESIWELAKSYHSSVERIKELNDTETELMGKMILIPKCI